MIRQPEFEKWDESVSFYIAEAGKISRLNEIFGNVELSREEERTLLWLAGWEESTVANIISAIKKVITSG